MRFDFAGAAHFAFSDLVFLLPQLAGTHEPTAQARIQPLVGTLDATAVYAAERAYILAYFDRELRSRGPVPISVLPLFPGRADDRPVKRHQRNALLRATKGDRVMNWIRRTWRFIVDRPLV